MVDWSYRSDYIAKHGVTVTEANEALADPRAVTYSPDPASLSGASDRTIGLSASANAILTVITVTEDGTVYGVNCWRSNPRDQARYREDNP
ncbi:transposase [Corynebacterium mastitidis]|uniref:Transposase n=1 Tax=Corynebacterium mastitidis TaxID=161890 RepID=A0ABU8NYR2_9CORY